MSFFWTADSILFFLLKLTGKKFLPEFQLDFLVS